MKTLHTRSSGCSRGNLPSCQVCVRRGNADLPRSSDLPAASARNAAQSPGGAMDHANQLASVIKIKTCDNRNALLVIKLFA